MIKFLTIESVLKIHQSRIDLYGGSFGVRDQGLLESAVQGAEQGFGDEYFHDFPFGMAAAYLFHISKNHPFVDGNKRTSLACLLIFLKINGYEMTATEGLLEELVMDTATGKMDKAGISIFLEGHCIKK